MCFIYGVYTVYCRIWKTNICFSSLIYTCSTANNYAAINIYKDSQCKGLPTYSLPLGPINTCLSLTPPYFVGECLGASSSAKPPSKPVSKLSKKPKAKPMAKPNQKKITSLPTAQAKVKKSKRNPTAQPALKALKKIKIKPTAKPTPMATTNKVTNSARQSQHSTLLLI
jgi:hypothetical protein